MGCCGYPPLPGGGAGRGAPLTAPVQLAKRPEGSIPDAVSSSCRAHAAAPPVPARRRAVVSPLSHHHGHHVFSPAHPASCRASRAPATSACTSAPAPHYTLSARSCTAPHPPSRRSYGSREAGSSAPTRLARLLSSREDLSRLDACACARRPSRRPLVSSPQPPLSVRSPPLSGLSARLASPRRRQWSRRCEARRQAAAHDLLTISSRLREDAHGRAAARSFENHFFEKKPMIELLPLATLPPAATAALEAPAALSALALLFLASCVHTPCACAGQAGARVHARAHA